MRVGFFSESLPYLPTHDGFTLYAANILREISKAHEVDLVSVVQPEDAEKIDWVRKHCRSVETVIDHPLPFPVRAASTGLSLVAGTIFKHRSRIRAMLTQLAKQRSWDVLHVEGTYVAAMVPTDLGI